MTQVNAFDLASQMIIGDVFKVTFTATSGCTYVRNKDSYIYDGTSDLSRLCDDSERVVSQEVDMFRAAGVIADGDVNANLFDSVRTACGIDLTEDDVTITVKSKNYVVILFHRMYIHAKKG